MGHGNLRTHRVFQLCLHGILLLRNAVLDGRRRCATRHSTFHVLDKWSERVYHKITPSVPAMQAADKHELLNLRGIAYYAHVQDMLDRQTHTPEGGRTQLRVNPKLNNGRVMRLLSG